MYPDMLTDLTVWYCYTLRNFKALGLSEGYVMLLCYVMHRSRRFYNIIYLHVTIEAQIGFEQLCMWDMLQVMENVHQNIFTTISDQSIRLREFSCFSSPCFTLPSTTAPFRFVLPEIHFLWKETLLLHSVGGTV